MQRIMILGASLFQIPIIKQAKEMGLYTIVLDYNPDSLGKKYADEFYQCSVKDKEKVLSIAKNSNIDGITAGMVDVAVCTVAYVAKELNLPGLPLSAATYCTDKYEMSKVFEANNIAHPKFQKISKSEIENISLSMTYPLISKPIDMAGSRGIAKIDNDGQLKECLLTSANASDSGQIIVEEFMSGPEVSVELLVMNGNPYVLQITDKETSGAPNFMEIGHTQPSMKHADVKAAIEKLACEVVKAIGLTNSLAHAEIIVSPEGPKMVEIGARMGGDSIQEQLIMLSTGINVPELCIKIALGETFDPPKANINKGSAICFIQSTPGTVVSINGIDEASDVDGVVEIVLTCKIGDKFTEAVDNSGRFGYILAQANTAEQAIEICQKALCKISIKTEGA